MLLVVLYSLCCNRTGEFIRFLLFGACTLQLHATCSDGQERSINIKVQREQEFSSRPHHVARRSLVAGVLLEALILVQAEKRDDVSSTRSELNAPAPPDRELPCLASTPPACDESSVLMLPSRLPISIMTLDIALLTAFVTSFATASATASFTATFSCAKSSSFACRVARLLPLPTPTMVLPALPLLVPLRAVPLPSLVSSPMIASVLPAPTTAPYKPSLSSLPTEPCLRDGTPGRVA